MCLKLAHWPSNESISGVNVWTDLWSLSSENEEGDGLRSSKLRSILLTWWPWWVATCLELSPQLMKLQRLFCWTHFASVSSPFFFSWRRSPLNNKNNMIINSYATICTLFSHSEKTTIINITYTTARIYITILSINSAISWTSQIQKQNIIGLMASVNLLRCLNMWDHHKTGTSLLSNGQVDSNLISRTFWTMLFFSSNLLVSILFTMFKAHTYAIP